MITIDPRKLRYHRQAKDLTLEALGKKLGGLTKSMISAWENGKLKVAPKYHAKLCEILGVTIDELAKAGEARTASEMQASLSPAAKPLSRRDHYILAAMVGGTFAADLRVEAIPLFARFVVAFADAALAEADKEAE